MLDRKNRGAVAERSQIEFPRTTIKIAFGGIETWLENLAFEVGPKGVRVVCLRMAANVDSNAIRTTARAMNVSDEQISEMLANHNLLKMPAKR